MADAKPVNSAKNLQKKITEPTALRRDLIKKEDGDFLSRCRLILSVQTECINSMETVDIMGYRMKTKPASMRVKVEKTETNGRTCGECRCGCWNMENLNYQHKPFIIYCGHSTYAHTKTGTGVCFDNTPACECFEEGEKEK